MGYSNGIEWDGSETVIGNQVGWMGQLWIAQVNTTTEPHPDNTDWQLNTPIQFTGLGVVEIPDPKDYLRVVFSGFGIEEEHINKPPEVKFYGFGIEAYRNKPYLIIVTD